MRAPTHLRMCDESALREGVSVRASSRLKPREGFRATKWQGTRASALSQAVRWIEGRGGGHRRCRAAARLCAGPEKQKATARVAFWNLVPVKRVELPTFALRMRCSTN